MVLLISGKLFYVIQFLIFKLTEEILTNTGTSVYSISD